MTAPTGVAMMLKAMGIDPEKSLGLLENIAQMGEDFKAQLNRVETALGEINAKLEKLNGHANPDPGHPGGFHGSGPGPADGSGGTAGKG